MQVKELAPRPVLSPYVQLIWCAEFDSSADFGGPERIAPDGIVELVFHYRGRVSVRAGPGGFAWAPRSALVCQTRNPIDIMPGGPVGFISVRFRPWGAHHFMPVPVAALADTIVTAGAVWGAGIAELEARLAEAPNPEHRVLLIQEFLTDQLNRHRNTGVEPVIRALWHRHSNVRVPKLARELGVSQRTLNRLMNLAVGMSPKAYARLTRFLTACALLRGRTRDSLADVAARCGYYDQAHFSEQIREYAGMTPTEVASAPAFSFLRLE